MPQAVSNRQLAANRRMRQSLDQTPKEEPQQKRYRTKPLACLTLRPETTVTS